MEIPKPSTERIFHEARVYINIRLKVLGSIWRVTLVECRDVWPADLASRTPVTVDYSIKTLPGLSSGSGISFRWLGLGDSSLRI